MKLQVTQENFHKALSLTSRVANSKNTLPILGNVLLECLDGVLKITATNLDIGIVCRVNAKILSPGSITMPARLTQDFIASLPSGTINLETDDNKIKISSGSYSSTINGIIADEFPVMPQVQAKSAWKISEKDCKKALSQVAFAASNDDSRPVLTGVNFQTHEGSLYVAATDSYRLAEKSLGKTSDEIALLVPVAAMQDLLKLLGDGSGDVEVLCDDQQVLFTAGDAQLVTRLIDGKYPDYKRLLPSQFEHTATLSRAEALNITKVSSLFARESAGSVVIDFDKDSQKVVIHSVASQLGENTSSSDAVVSESGSITLNSRYLLEGLSAFGSDEITIGFNGKTDPCVLMSADDATYLHVVMPLRS
jgi:DNA polymerase III subunit beta